MKRRSFLQVIGAAVAALFAPKVAAKTNADYLVDPNKWFIKPTVGHGELSNHLCPDSELSEESLEQIVIDLSDRGEYPIAIRPTKIIWGSGQS